MFLHHFLIWRNFLFTNTTQNEAPFGEKLGERRPLKAYSVDALFLCFLGLIARLLSSVAETLSIHSFILLPHLQHYTAVRKSSTHSALSSSNWLWQQTQVSARRILSAHAGATAVSSGSRPSPSSFLQSACWTEQVFFLKLGRPIGGVVEIFCYLWWHLRHLWIDIKNTIILLLISMLYTSQGRKMTWSVYPHSFRSLLSIHILFVRFSLIERSWVRAYPGAKLFISSFLTFLVLFVDFYITNPFSPNLTWDNVILLGIRFS